MTLITLRQGDQARFAVDARPDDCKMITSDLGGTRLLARLLWGLSYQHRPGTLLLLDPAHLVPNPHDAHASTPTVFMVAPLSTFDASAARHLRRQLPLRTGSEGPVTWNTASYPAALADYLAWREDRRNRVPMPDRYWPEPRLEPRVEVVGGILVIAAEARTLRDWALFVGDLGDYWYYEEACAEPDAAMRFDVHAVRHFHRKVSVACRAREEILSTAVGPIEAAILHDRIVAHTATVAARHSGPWDPAPEAD